MPPVSKVMPLPTRARAASSRFAPPLYSQHDQLGRLVRCRCATARKRAHAELLHVLALEHLDLDAVALAELLRLLGEVGRRADVARQVAEVLGERDAVGDRAAPRASAVSPAAISLRRATCSDDLAQRALRRSAPCSSAGRSGRAPSITREHRVLDLPAGVAALHGQVGEADRRFRGARGLAAPSPRPRSAARYAASPNSRSRPRPTSSTRSAATPRHAVQQQRRAGLALEVAAAQHLGDVAARGLVDRLRPRPRACGPRTRRPRRSPCAASRGCRSLC